MQEQTLSRAAAVIKVQEMIRAYDVKWRGKNMNEAIHAILDDPEYWQLSVEEKSLFALMLCGYAR